MILIEAYKQISEILQTNPVYLHALVGHIAMAMLFATTGTTTSCKMRKQTFRLKKIYFYSIK